MDSFNFKLLIVLNYNHELGCSAHIPKEGKNDVTFMDVYKKSACKTRELLVDIIQEYPDEIEHTYIPSCVVLMRCAGCCNDSQHNCSERRKRLYVQDPLTCKCSCKFTQMQCKSRQLELNERT